MPLEDTGKVDAISTEPATGSVVLTIFNAWEWSDERAHLLALQAKLNAYFDFIQSGQIREAYPSTEGRPATGDPSHDQISPTTMWGSVSPTGGVCRGATQCHCSSSAS
jgi:hypothetical protein